MKYEVALADNQAWWERQFPRRAELSVPEVARCLHVKPDKLRNDPAFPSFRDGRVYKITIPRLARWQTDRAFGKFEK